MKILLENLNGHHWYLCLLPLLIVNLSMGEHMKNYAKCISQCEDDVHDCKNNCSHNPDPECPMKCQTIYEACESACKHSFQLDSKSLPQCVRGKRVT